MITYKFENSMSTAVTSYMASVRFVKHLIKVSLVNIVYHRVNVDPNAFEIRSVKEYKYMACKPYTEDPVALTIFYASKGVADAIRNKYLREVYLIFKNKESGEISEYYKFSLTYKEEPESITIPKPEEVIKASIEFIKSIELLGNYAKLSSNLDIVVELSFFKNITPNDYLPPHFQKLIDSVPFMQQLPDFMSPPIRVGYVNTGYHKIKCRATGQYASFNTPFSTPQKARSSRSLSCNDVEHEILEEENNLPSQQLQNDKANDIQADSNQGNDKEKEVQDNTNDLNPRNDCKIEKILQKSICGTVSDTSEVLANLNTGVLDNVPKKYRCSCEIHEEINGIQTIVCSICLHHQHTVCVGFENAVSVPDPYVCIYCKQEGRPATDKIMSDYGPHSWKSIAALRLGLMQCKNYKNCDMDVKKVINNLPKKIQYLVCEVLNKTKVIEKGEGMRVKFLYQAAERVALGVFNAVILPDSLQLCDEEIFEDNKSTEKKKKRMLQSFKETEDENLTEILVSSKRMRRAIRF